jgi:hypothetical protein
MADAVARPKKPQGPNAHRVLAGAPRVRPRTRTSFRIKPPTKRGARIPEQRGQQEQSTGVRAAIKRRLRKRKGPVGQLSSIASVARPRK